MPAAPGTRMRERVAPPALACRSASSVPSPPSAMGRARMAASGQTRRSPASSAAQAADAVSEPLNESGARTMFTLRAALALAGCYLSQAIARAQATSVFAVAGAPVLPYARGLSVEVPV